MRFLAYILAILKSINENLIAGTNTSVVLTIGASTIISIMAVALPLLINTIVNLDKRYNSTYVVDVFMKRCSVLTFMFLLLFAIMSIIGWTVVYKSLQSIQKLFDYILLASTFFLILGTLYLIFDIICFSIPSSLLKIIKKEINKIESPIGYYSIMPNAQEVKEITDFDDATYKYFGILACLYIDSIKKGDRQTEEITNYWKTITQPIAIDSTRTYVLNTIQYPSCYYYFIHEIEKWTYKTNKRSLPYTEVVDLTKMLLHAHITRDNYKYFWDYSFETLDNIWKSLRDIIDNDMDDMFKYFWQVVNNACMIRESYKSIPSSVKADVAYSQQVYSSRAFLCCSYLLSKKKYDLLKYAINYSQSVPLKRPMLPNTIDEVLNNYVYWRRWNSDFEKSEYLHLWDDNSTTARVNTIDILTNFAVFMASMIFAKNEKEKERFTQGNVRVQTYSKDEFILYVGNLAISFKTDSEWATYFDLPDITFTPEQRVSIFELLKDNYQTNIELQIKQTALSQSRKEWFYETTLSESVEFWSDVQMKWPKYLTGKKLYHHSELKEFKLDKKYFVHGFEEYNRVSYKLKLPATACRYDFVALLRNYFIEHTQTRIETLYPDDTIWNEIIAQIRVEHPAYDTKSVFREAKNRALSTMGKQLRDIILYKYLGTAPFTSQMAIISFMPSLRKLLAIKDAAHYYNGIQIIDIFDEYYGPENDRFQKHIYNSIFIVKKSDLPYVHFAKVDNSLAGYELLDKKIPIYTKIAESNDKLSVSANVYIPYEIYGNDKQFKQIILKFKPIIEEEQQDVQ